MTQRERLNALAVDAALVAVALADSILLLVDPHPLALTLAVASSFGLLLRRRWPWVSFALALAALITSSALVASLIALYSVAVAERRRWPVGLAGLAVVVATSSAEWGGALGVEAVPLVLYWVMTAAAPIALGLLVRTRRQLTERLRELEQARESERRRADEVVLSTERARIAREMHDVVSHEVSLIAVQAGALQVASRDPDVRQAAGTVRALAVATLDELRQMVTVLRSAAGGLEPIAPQPRIGELPALIETSGIETTASIELPEDLPASAQRAIYRTVQEALTNIRKHAPGASVSVRALTVGHEAQVSVLSTPGTAPSLALPSSGHGLIGLRERAELLGGSLDAHPTADGGFALTLRIPLH
ncbi:MAG: histidine kinase [Dermabacter sp.]|nr:histidine kinase [Dermabacter sp.]